MKPEREAVARAFEGRVFSLVALDWAPFAKEASLRFVSRKHELRLVLEGVHFVSFRQSMLDFNIALGESCEVRDVRVYETDALLTGLDQDAIFGLQSKMFVYDRAERPKQDPDFAAPFHVLVNCAAGILDAVCEVARVEAIAPN